MIRFLLAMALMVLVTGARATNDLSNDSFFEEPQPYLIRFNDVEPKPVLSLLSQQTYINTLRMAKHYAQLALQDTWQSVPNLYAYHYGDEDLVIGRLKRRLALVGDLDERFTHSNVYDTYLTEAIRSYQARNGLSRTGAIDPDTAESINVSFYERYQQLKSNLKRLRHYKGVTKNARYAVLNIPSAKLDTVEHDRITSSYAAVVGQPSRQSPVMQTKAVEINFNPYWTIPRTIVIKDLIPALQHDPAYLKRNRIRVFDGSKELPQDGLVIDQKKFIKYVFRQDFGADVNTMGFVRINIVNPYGVYMHDTLIKSTFAQDFRYISSGCVRVQDSRKFVLWLLRSNPGWTPERINTIVNEGVRKDQRLVKPVQIFWTYLTAWVSSDGVTHFYKDIYRKDAQNTL